MPRKPFDGPKLKLARARKHIAELDAAVAAALDRDIVAIVVTRHKRSGQDALLIWQGEMPEELPAIFGDAVHNLRTSLDLLANDAVALGGAKPKGVKFPFAADGHSLEQQITDKLKQATDDVQEMVRQLKPFRGGNDLLRALHDLDMRDKHEALVLSKPRIASGRIPLRYEGSNVWGPDYQNIGLLPFAQDPSYHDPDHDVIGKLPGCMVELLIADGFPLAGQPALSILNKQSELVQRIIESFEAHFQGSG